VTRCSPLGEYAPVSALDFVSSRSACEFRDCGFSLVAAKAERTSCEYIGWHCPRSGLHRGFGDEAVSPVSAESGLGPQLESFREGRRRLEEAVLPLATSVDGRRFSFQASLHNLEFQIGGYVVLDGDGTPRLGQVLAIDLDQLSTELMLPTGADGAENRTQVLIRYARGEGTILEGDPAPFHDALVRVATGADVQGWLQQSQRRYAQLRFGDLALSPGVPCLADASGFNRHTFLCGQSGSGKTYSLGVILERLLMETDLRMVVLDPNSDFVRLGNARADADPVLAERYQ